MKTIFVSEDKDSAEIFNRIMNVLYDQDLEINFTNTLQESVQIAVDKGPFNLIFIDMDMKDCDPSETLEEIIDVNGDCPIIFTGTQTMIKDRVEDQVFESNKLNDKMPKPIDKDKILNIVKPLIDNIRPKMNREGVLEVDPNEFIKMKVKFFYLYESFGYDLYTEVTQTKYMKVIEANLPYSHSYIHKFIKNAITYFYIHKDDHLRYLEEESQKCIRVLKKVNGAHKDIFLVLIRSISILHEYLRTLGVSDTVINLADLITDIIIDISEKRKNFHNVISFYPVAYESIASKSLLCAVMSLLFAQELTWQAIATKRNLVLASILADFTVDEEKMCFSMTLNEAMLNDFSREEISKYSDHTNEAAKIGSQFTQYPDVDYIIRNHHELPNKKGFPQRPSPSVLTPICGVISICHHIAIRIDGHKITNKIIHNILGNMNQYFAIANYKPILKIANDALKLKS